MLTLERKDAVRDLPLPRRLKLFLLSQDENVEGNPGKRPIEEEPTDSQDSATEKPTEDGETCVVTVYKSKPRLWSCVTVIF